MTQIREGCATWDLSGEFFDHEPHEPHEKEQAFAYFAYFVVLSVFQN